jgi:hypothetical protein
MTNRNQLFETNPDTIVCPRALEETFYEIIKSNGKVDTANNNPNFHKGKYKLIVSDWLDDTNNWFLIDSELMKDLQRVEQRVPLEFGQAGLRRFHREVRRLHVLRLRHAGLAVVYGAGSRLTKGKGESAMSADICLSGK